MDKAFECVARNALKHEEHADVLSCYPWTFDRVLAEMLMGIVMLFFCLSSRRSVTSLTQWISSTKTKPQARREAAVNHSFARLHMIVCLCVFIYLRRFPC